MTKTDPFKGFHSSPEIIRLAVMMYVRFPLSRRNVEDLLHERGIGISHETVRYWWNRFGPMFAAEIRRKRVQQMRAYSNCRWHMDEVFVKINGERHSLWRAVDHEGEVLESFVAKRRDRKAALKVLKTSMKRHGRPHTLVTDKLRSNGAAMKVVGNANRQETGRWENNRAENAHPLPDSGLLANHEKGPFRRRERACNGSAACDVYRNSPPFMPPSTPISTRSARFIAETISRPTEPLLSPSGAKYVRHKVRHSAAN
jgi:putative transposase